MDPVPDKASRWERSTVGVELVSSTPRALQQRNQTLAIVSAAVARCRASSERGAPSGLDSIQGRQRGRER